MAALSLGVAVGQSPSPAVVAIASGPTLTLYDASGAVVKSIDLQHPVAGFALSPDQSQLVIVSPDREHGGALFLVDLRTGSRKKLTGGPFAFRHLNPNEKEVYDSPAFSPDGRNLVFAVHGDQPGDGNDASENSGPLAIFDLDTSKERVLSATNHFPGSADGPCSEGDPQWSPDGKWILFNCEDGGFVTDPGGKRVRDLKLDSGNTSSSSVGWVGTKCVLYTQVPMKGDQFDFEHETIKLLNVDAEKSFDAGMLLKGFSGPATGLQRASGDALIREIRPKLIVETRTKRWKFRLRMWYEGPQTVAAQLLTGWSSDLTPAECK